MRVTTEWTLSVISGCEISAQCRELNNAILYSERINWIPTIKLWGVEYTNGLDHALYYLALLGEMDRNCLLTQRYLNTCETLQKLGIKIQIPEGARCYEQRVRNVFRPAVRLFVKNPSDYQDFAARLTKLQHEEEARIFAENMALLPRSDAILFLDEPSRAVAAQGIWDTRVSTQALVNSLSSISFADVSDLNFDELILIKDRTKDMIDPVRAQLLRLTKKLRELSGENYQPKVLEAEADNLVRTEILPDALELNKLIDDLRRNKLRRVLNSIVKGITFMGAGFIVPDFRSDASRRSADAFSSIIDDKAERPGISPAARFLVEVSQAANVVRSKR